MRALIAKVYDYLGLEAAQTKVIRRPI